MAGTLTAPRPTAVRGPITMPRAARLMAFAPLALFCGLHWAALVSPPANEAFAGVIAASCAAGAVLIGVGHASRRVRVAVVAALALLLAGLAFVAAGAPIRLLWPKAWDELGDGLGSGISALPAVAAPYAGADEWTRTALLLGGMLLVELAALVAFWPGRRRGQPLAGAVALGVVYGIAIVQRHPATPLFDGAVFCVLLAGFLWLERLHSGQLAAATLGLIVATALGALVAPRLDGADPWLDYREIASSLEPPTGASFTWDHRYGPLDWPRDGREVLRIRAPDSLYWKAANLDAFDGVRWLASERPGSLQDELPTTLRPGWRKRIRVVDRGLGGNELIGAGSTLGVIGVEAVQRTPGVFERVGRELSPGESYEAVVYSPRPSAAQMRRAGTAYGGTVERYLDVGVPVEPGATVQLADAGLEVPARGRLLVRFAPFGTPEAASTVLWRRGTRVDDPELRLLRDGPYGRVYELARSLRAQATTPFEYAQLVMARVRRGAVYSEDVAETPYPLATFLFDDRRGYCQQFSGAMALLLRMGGVPARVSAGFSPGNYDRSQRAYVVRDTDAHSWVEAYFPGYGWVTFDPTPAAAPARAQQDDPGGTPAGGQPTPARPSSRPEAPSAAGGGEVTVAATDDGPGWALLGPIIGLAAMAAMGGALLAWRGRLPGGPAAPELAELQRALHRSGRTPSPRTTLAQLEQLLGGGGAGAAYVRAVRRARFEGADARPTAAQRRALRRELAAGLGLPGRLRAWWALPPAPWPRLSAARARRYPAR